MSTPAWLIDPERGFGACSCCGKRTKGDFVEKTIVGGSRVLRSTMFSSDVANADGVLQRVDPRVKVVSTLALLVVTALTRHVSVLIGLYALTIAFATMSRIGLRYMVMRVWCFVPIFTAVVVIPAALNVVTPGHVVVPLGSWFGTRLGLTAPGLTSAAFIIVRVATSISLVVLLTTTTPWARLLAALGSLRVPREFVLILALAYRYLFYLLGTITDMYEARKARAPRDRDLARGRAFVAATAGSTFAKAHALSEEVYLAMLAHGYTARPTAADRRPFRLIDAYAGAVVVAAAFVAIGVDHVVAR